MNGVVTNYTLHGKNVVHMTRGNDELHFFYDAQNRPAIVVYNGTAYAYVNNLQGDIIAILDSTGAVVVSYTYDAWGMPTSIGGTLAASLGVLNPFRYRGYVYDEETGLYYLRSRYYNPVVSRFVNIDSTFAEKNLYSYCKNSPASHVDSDGHCTACAIVHTDSEIIYEVPIYSQGNRALCWAYCQIMREEYEKKCKYGAEYTYISQNAADFRATYLAEQYHSSRCQNCSTEIDQHGGWPLNISSYETQQFYSFPSIATLYAVLEEHGPILLTYFETVESTGKNEAELVGHDVLLTGVNLCSQEVIMANPWGAIGFCSYDKLSQGFIYRSAETRKIGLGICDFYPMPFYSYAVFDE